MVEDTGNQAARLEAGDQEHHAFDEINEKFPEEDALKARRGANQPEAVPTHVEPCRYRGKNAGSS